MSETGRDSLDPERGAQADFIGKRKRAMWRAATRIPDDPRVISFNFDLCMKNLMNNLASELYKDVLKPNPFIGMSDSFKKELDSPLKFKPIPIGYGFAK